MLIFQNGTSPSSLVLYPSPPEFSPILLTDKVAGVVVEGNMQVFYQSETRARRLKQAIVQKSGKEVHEQ